MTEQEFVHVEIDVSYNTKDYSTWGDPVGKSKLNFALPVFAYASMDYSELVKNLVENASEEYLVALTEMEKKAMEEALEEDENE